MRKIQELGAHTEYYIVDYDFAANGKGRQAFYRDAKKLLGFPIKHFALTESVIGLSDSVLAMSLFDCAIKHGVVVVVLRIAQTINKYPKYPEAEENEK